jgi:1-acyl-sn-glycerol-3-phosphate acyltransferase
MNTNFLPNIKSPLTEYAMDLLMPFAKHVAGVNTISIDSATTSDLFNSLSSPALIVANHPTDMDPILVRTLGTSVGHRFNYLACREGFDNLRGVWGWAAQRIGAFSIVRGTVDRESFRHTIKLWVNDDAHIVVFPEGEVGAFNDKLLPFHDGIFQLLLLASEKRVASGKNPIGILPLGLRYSLTSDQHSALLKASIALCFATGAQRSDDLIDNLRSLAFIVIARLEVEYGLSANQEITTEDRIGRLQTAVLQRIHATTGKSIPEHGDLHDLMRISANIIEDAIDGHSPHETIFDKRLALQRRQRALALQADIDRLQNWIAIEDGYATSNGNQDHAYELIRHFEIEVFGKVCTHLKRNAKVTIGPRLDLSKIDGFEDLPRRQQIRMLRQLSAESVAACLALSLPG